MKKKNIVIRLIFVGFLSTLIQACSGFKTPADTEIKPIKVTLLNTSYNRQRGINTRQAVVNNTTPPVNITQGEPVRLDHVAPPDYYTGTTNQAITFTAPHNNNSPSEVRFQPAPATEFDFPTESDSNTVSNAPADNIPPPVTETNSTTVAESNPPPVTDPDPIAAVLAAQQPVTTNDSAAAVSVTVNTPKPDPDLAATQTPSVIVDTMADNSDTTASESVTMPEPEPTAITNTDSTPPPVIVDTQTPSSTPQEVTTDEVAAEPSLNKLTAAEQAQAEQTVKNLLAQTDLAPMTAYINQYELDFARYPYVQRVRVVRDQRCREAAASFLTKGEAAFMDAYGKWCSKRSFTQVAR